jgi:hypothetical protein
MFRADLLSSELFAKQGGLKAVKLGYLPAHRKEEKIMRAIHFAMIFILNLVVRSADIDSWRRFKGTFSSAIPPTGVRLKKNKESSGVSDEPAAGKYSI